MIVYLLDRAFKLMQHAPVDGAFVEFGVFRGNSLITSIKLTKKYFPENISFYGFDTFEGMPETKAPLTNKLKNEWRKGSFSNTDINFVKQKLKNSKLKATLIKGKFKDLKPLSNYKIKKIRFAHIDADIYEGYRDALDKITPYIQVGTVLLFDEYLAPSDYQYQDIKKHGTKAIYEWEQKTGFNLHLIRFKWSCGLCVIVDEQYLKDNGTFIESLRNDNLIQSFMDILRQIVHRLGI